MKSLWSYYQNLYNKEICESIIANCKPRLQWANTISSAKKNIRKSKVCWIKHDDQKLGFIHRDFWLVMNHMNRDNFRLNVSNLPSIQFSEYSEDYEGCYNTHTDFHWASPSNFDYQRKISVVVQLSDPNSYEGGIFYFDDDDIVHPDYNLFKNQGTIFMFPSFLKHGVKPVTKGTRYSLVAWFEGPAWT